MDERKYKESLAKKEYVKGRGDETEYYIITAKYGDDNYKLTLLRNNTVVFEDFYEGLTKAKYGAFEWLLYHNPSMFKMNIVTMVHYKEDRPSGNPWVKDTNIELHKNLEEFLATKGKIDREEQTHKNTWIFQGNPNRFNVNKYLLENEEIVWGMRQDHYLGVIQEGDTVFIWRSDAGKKGSGGVVAKTVVTGMPLVCKIPSAYWADEAYANEEMPRVPLHVLELALDGNHLNREYLMNNDKLSDLAILKMSNSTNYRLPIVQAEELLRLWEVGKVSNEIPLPDSASRKLEKDSVNNEPTKPKMTDNESLLILIQSEILNKVMGIDFNRIKIVRHAEKEETDYKVCDLYRQGMLDFYQSVQSKRRFDDCDYILSFIGGVGSSATFVGAYKVGTRIDFDRNKVIIPTGFPLDKAFNKSSYHHYELKKINFLNEMIEKLVVDWGSYALSWSLLLHKNDKKIISFEGGYLVNTNEKTDDELIKEIEDELPSDIETTTKELIVKSRVGQGIFKQRVSKLCNKCKLCGVDNIEFLRASHSKPWKDSNNLERLDQYNGFLFCPAHDTLYDKGYISFEDNGAILISPFLDETSKMFMNVNKEMRIVMLEGHKRYMEYHRQHIYRR